MRRLSSLRSLAPFALACVVGVAGFTTFANAANTPAAGAGAGGAAPADPGAPAVSSLANQLEGFGYSQSHTDIVKAYNQVGGIFDKEYNPVLQKMQPGVRMEATEAERDRKKNAFAGSFLEFGDSPLGFDTTGLVGEYSYKNHEYVLILRRDIGRRFFFFFGAPPNDKLWKMYDEWKLGDGLAWGKSYQEAVQKMTNKLGVAGRARPADPAKGFSRAYTEWQDGNSHLRVIDRGAEGLVGIAINSRSIEANLPGLRANKVEDPFAMDPSVAAATNGSLSDPNSVNASPDAGAKPGKPGAKPGAKPTH